MKKPHFLFGKVKTKAKDGKDAKKILKDLNKLRLAQGCTMDTWIDADLNIKIELRVRCEDIDRIGDVVERLHALCKGKERELDIHIDSEGNNWDPPKLK